MSKQREEIFKDEEVAFSGAYALLLRQYDQCCKNSERSGKTKPKAIVKTRIRKRKNKMSNEVGLK